MLKAQRVTSQAFVRKLIEDGIDVSKACVVDLVTLRFKFDALMKAIRKVNRAHFIEFAHLADLDANLRILRSAFSNCLVEILTFLRNEQTSATREEPPNVHHPAISASPGSPQYYTALNVTHRTVQGIVENPNQRQVDALPALPARNAIAPEQNSFDAAHNQPPPQTASERGYPSPQPADGGPKIELPKKVRGGPPPTQYMFTDEDYEAPTAGRDSSWSNVNNGVFPDYETLEAARVSAPLNAPSPVPSRRSPQSNLTYNVPNHQGMLVPPRNNQTYNVPNRQAMSASPRPNLTFNVPNHQAMLAPPRAHQTFNGMNQRKQLVPPNASLQVNIGKGQKPAANVIQGTFNQEFEALNQLHETVNNVVADVRNDPEASFRNHLQELNRQVNSMYRRYQNDRNETEVIQAAQPNASPAITRKFVD